MRQHLVEIFGHKATDEPAESVLNGTFTPPQNIDPYVTKLLPHLTRPKTVTGEGKINTEIKTNEYIQAWKSKNEYTGSGPSGLHYGHFKAMVWNTKNAHFHTCIPNNRIQPTAMEASRRPHGAEKPKQF